MSRLLAPVMLLFVAVGGAVAASGAAGERAEVETRIVAPLADPALEAGVARCMSDGACVVTDARGTRAATPLRSAP